MPSILRRYLLWVLLPTAAACLGAHVLLLRTHQEQVMTAATRAGVVTTALFRSEMAEKAAELTLTAPVLASPDPASPIIQAVLEGDTVAALSFLPEGLGLSVALREVTPMEEGAAPRREEEPPFRIRATTDVFAPRAPALLHSRTGYGVAFYLRGQRVSSEPPELGPAELPAELGSMGASRDFPTLDTGAGPGILLPVDPTRRAASAVHFLIVPPAPSSSGMLRRGGGWLALLGILLGFALMAVRIGRLLKPQAPPPRTILLTAAGLPLLGLWLALGVSERSFEEETAEARGGEMVRILALLKEADRSLGLEDAVAGTDLGLTRAAGGEAMESTLPQGELLARVAGLQPPPPTFPSTGVVTTAGDAQPFASLREASGTILTLTAPGDEALLRWLRVVLAGMGGLASLAGLGFLLVEGRRRGA